MIKEDNGGPAFPCDNIVERNDNGNMIGHEISSPGLSIRDYFAAKAMPLVFNHWDFGGDTLGKQDVQDGYYNSFAEDCYSIADAMLLARSK